MSYPKAAMLVLPYARLELPAWGKVLNLAGVTDDSRWKEAPRRQIRGKWHGFLMDLKLSNWSERRTFFLGRFYDLPLQLLVRIAVQPGETFIDVGANIGMISLLAAKCVGDTGTVHSFEPNPEVVKTVHRCLKNNAITHVTLHGCGLSDAESTLTLSVVTEHTGMGTFADLPDDQRSLVSNTYAVRVCRGDDELPENLEGPAMIKVDTEGFECRALRGLEGTIRRLKPIIATEAVASHLARAGSSIEELFNLLRSWNYQPYALNVARRGLRYRLQLQPLTVPADLHCDDMVWIDPGTIHADRLAPFIG